MENYAIKFENVSKIYKLKKKNDGKNKSSVTKRFYALKDISFEIPKGEVVGILGTNGSGKSTLSLILAGISEIDEGTMFVNGEQSLVAINTGLNKQLTGLENINVKGALLGLSKKRIQEIVDGVIEFAELGDFLYQPVKKYSSGMKSRLGFSISLYLNPDIIIVGIPGGIIPINNEFTNKFGMTAIEIGYSINADIMVLNINYDDYADDFYDEMSLLVKYKFNIDSLYFGMTNHKIDFQRSREANILRFVTVDMEKIKCKISQNNNVYEVTEYGINELYNKIVEELSGSDIQII